jgi:HEAT repeat protein
VPTPAANNDPATERQLAAAFMAELIICRRTIQSYPDTHPAVEAATEKVVRRLAPLAAGDRKPTFGVTRKGILLHDELLDSARFGEFADMLASFGIIAISFSDLLGPDDLREFNRIMNTPRTTVWEQGGIRQTFSDSGIHGIRVQAINPAVFILTDEIDQEPAEPWDIFVRRLLDGYFSLSREMLVLLLAAPPADLAAEFDAILAGVPEEARHQSLRAVADFFAGLDRRQEVEGLDEGTFDKICDFIASLSPQMRSDFILLVCRSARTTTGFSERLLQRLPGAELLRIMEAITTQGEIIPEKILTLMQHLSAQARANPALDAAIGTAGAAERARALFRKPELEKYVPPAYRETLMTVLATDSLPAADLDSLNELRETLEADQLESKAAAVIAEIMNVVPIAEQGDGIRRNLVEMASHFLGNGDFDAVTELCGVLLSRDREAGGSKFIDPEFVDRVLDTATFRGRESYAGIRSIIAAVGRPFVTPLIDRLAEEENFSLRRFWFDCLNDLGEMVRTAALELLDDDRWYVVRNLLILLRNFNDEEVQRQVRRLAGSPHVKIRNEALRSLLHYRDPNAHRLLLAELASSDHSRVLAAVQNAEMSTHRDVASRLLAILDMGGFKEHRLEIKSAAVQSLAAAGNLHALPKFIAILRSTSLFNAALLNQLKVEIIRVLPRFPAEQVRPILEDLAATGGKTLAPVAAETLKRFQGGVL